MKSGAVTNGDPYAGSGYLRENLKRGMGIVSIIVCFALKN
jgi:hypothetical protein